MPRKKLPPLLVAAGERNPERLHWLGASFGVTGPLLRLWKRAGFKLVYLRQTTSDLTGTHTRSKLLRKSVVRCMLDVMCVVFCFRFRLLPHSFWVVLGRLAAYLSYRM